MKASLECGADGTSVRPGPRCGPAGSPCTGTGADPVVAGWSALPPPRCGSTGADRRRSRPLPVAGPPVARGGGLPGRGGGRRRRRRTRGRPRPRARRRPARRATARPRRLRAGRGAHRAARCADRRPGVEPGAAGLRPAGRRQPGAGVHRQGGAQRGGAAGAPVRPGGSRCVQRLSSRAGRVVAVAGAAAGVGAGCALVWGGYEGTADLLAPTLVLEVAVGWSFIAVGLVAWTRRPGSSTGALVFALGFAWFARFAVAIAVRPALVVGVLLSSLYLSVLVHLLATFPSGRVQNTAERVLVIVAYLLSAPLDAVFLLLGAQRGLGQGPPPGGLVIASRAGVFTPTGVDLAVQSVVVLLFGCLLALVFVRWRSAGPAQRRSLTPGVLGGVVIVVTILVDRTAILLLIPPSLGVVFEWAAQVVLVVWPLALLLGLLRSQLDRSAVSRLIVELGAGLPVPERLRGVLARTLHDPSLELAYWLPERKAFVDGTGSPVLVGSAEGR